MDFKQLRAFISVAETGSVTKAAQLLNLVQPAVSRQLRLLEEDVGNELFVRGRHGMSLTDAGKSLLVYGRRAMLELDRARADLGGTTEVGGLVTVGLLPSTCDVISSRLITAMRARYPGVRMRISMGYAGTLQHWLETGEIDAALLYGLERTPGFQTTVLLEEDLWVVGSPSAKLRRHKPVALARLAGQPLILPSGPHGIRTLLDHACAMSNVELTVAAETNAMSVQKCLVRGGHGMTILPPIAIVEELSLKQVTAAPLRDPTITRRIVLALPTNRPVGRPVQRSVEVLVECAKDAVKSGAWLEARWLAA